MKKTFRFSKLSKRVKISFIVIICLSIIGINYYPFQVILFEKKFTNSELIQSSWDSLYIHGKNYEDALSSGSTYISVKDKGEKSSLSIELQNLSNLSIFSAMNVPYNFSSVHLSFSFKLSQYGFLGPHCNYKNFKIYQIITESGYSYNDDNYLVISEFPSWGKIDYQMWITSVQFSTLYEHLVLGDNINIIEIRIELEKEANLGITILQINQITVDIEN